MTSRVAVHRDAGAGALLGFAAGDALAHAGSGEPYGYLTQQGVLVAYHLLRHGEVVGAELSAELAAFAHPESGRGLYRQPSTLFESFVGALHAGHDAVTSRPDTGAALRVTPLATWYRREAAGLVEGVIAACSISHSHPSAIEAACALAGAVAAASLGQSGHDLLRGAAEVAATARTRLEKVPEQWEPDDRVSEAFSRLGPLVGAPVAEVVADLATGGDVPPAEWAVGAIVIAAPLRLDASRVLHTVSETGGAALGAMVGAILGSRLGLLKWPWTVSNEMWFAELGRRLARQDREYQDLPDPYAVEAHLESGGLGGP